MTSRTRAVSFTVRHNGPTRVFSAAPIIPSRLTSSWVGARPTMLLFFAGWCMDPPVSSPVEHVTRFAATDDPEPPLEVPGVRVVSYGLQNGPPKELREFGVPISPMFALARMIAPASRKRLTKVASLGGRSFA